jgi:hypothetical protein
MSKYEFLFSLLFLYDYFLGRLFLKQCVVCSMYIICKAVPINDYYYCFQIHVNISEELITGTLRSVVIISLSRVKLFS